MTKQEWHTAMLEMVAILEIRCRSMDVRITGYNEKGILWDVGTTSMVRYVEVKFIIDKYIEEVGKMVFSKYPGVTVKFENGIIDF